ncbi:hypothetical protein Pcinc_032356, partial [Petrolisthes cinctipes]
MDDEGRQEGAEGNLNGREMQEEEGSTGITEGYSTGRDMEKEKEGCEGPEKRVVPRRGKCRRRRRIDRIGRKRISVGRVQGDQEYSVDDAATTSPCVYHRTLLSVSQSVIGRIEFQVMFLVNRFATQ